MAGLHLHSPTRSRLHALACTTLLDCLESHLQGRAPMARRKLKLKIVDSTPCPQPWSGMQGTERERHCETCNKRVHNFAAMSALQVEQLVREKEGHLCARVTYRSDGSIRTLDGPTQPSVAAGLVLAASLAFSTSRRGRAGFESPRRPHGAPFRNGPIARWHWSTCRRLCHSSFEPRCGSEHPHRCQRQFPDHGTTWAIRYLDRAEHPLRRSHPRCRPARR
jgi:hypothetical protein